MDWFKTDKSSLKSECIWPHTLLPVTFFAKFRNRSHSLMDGTALPVAVLVRLHLVEVGIAADSLVHTFRL